MPFGIFVSLRVPDCRQIVKACFFRYSLMPLFAVLRRIVSVFRTVGKHNSSVGQGKIQRAFRWAGKIVNRRYQCGGILA